MTPETSGDISLDTTAHDLGFDNVNAMVEAAKKGKARDAYDGRQKAKIRELEERLRDIEERKEEADLGIDDNSDETSRRLARELRDVKGQLASVLNAVLSTPEDEELEPYLVQAEDENPEVASIKDPIRRKNTIRRLARQLKSESENSGGGSRRDASEAHFTGGDIPVTRRSSANEDQDLARYQRELRAAKRGDKEAVNAKYRVRYPHWGI